MKYIIPFLIVLLSGISALSRAESQHYDFDDLAKTPGGIEEKSFPLTGVLHDSIKSYSEIRDREKSAYGNIVDDKIKLQSRSENDPGAYEYTVKCTGTTFSGLPPRKYSGVLNARNWKEAYRMVEDYQNQHHCNDMFGSRYGSDRGYAEVKKH